MLSNQFKALHFVVRILRLTLVSPEMRPKNNRESYGEWSDWYKLLISFFSHHNNQLPGEPWNERNKQRSLLSKIGLSKLRILWLECKALDCMISQMIGNKVRSLWSYIILNQAPHFLASILLTWISEALNERKQAQELVTKFEVAKIKEIKVKHHYPVLESSRIHRW